MTEETNFALYCSRENWKVLAIVLMIFVGVFLTLWCSVTIARKSLQLDIINSGYTITEVNSPSNTFYIIERN